MTDDATAAGDGDATAAGDGDATAARDGDGGPLGALLEDPLGAVRGEPTVHWGALVAALVVGVLAATVHWMGLVVGGALVGLVTTSLRRALFAGLGFAVVAVLAWAALIASSTAFGKVVAMGQIPVLAVAMALVLSVLGSLVRGVV